MKDYRVQVLQVKEWIVEFKFSRFLEQIVEL